MLRSSRDDDSQDKGHLAREAGTNMAVDHAACCKHTGCICTPLDHKHVQTAILALMQAPVKLSHSRLQDIEQFGAMMQECIRSA